MWRRTYLLLVLIRLWFALSPSYLHPDENFQGPEVIAGTFRPMSLYLFFFLPLLRDTGHLRNSLKTKSAALLAATISS
jgi:hypothetical protein